MVSESNCCECIIEVMWKCGVELLLRSLWGKTGRDIQGISPAKDPNKGGIIATNGQYDPEAVAVETVAPDRTHFSQSLSERPRLTTKTAPH